VTIFNRINNIAGILLLICGVLAVPAFYLIIGSIPLTALCISLVILGTTCVAINRTVTDASKATIFLGSTLVVFCLVCFLLSISGVNNILTYFSVEAIAYLVVTMIYLSYDPKPNSALTILSTVLLCMFLLFMFLHVIDVLE
jgi:hypothetical protein